MSREESSSLSFHLAGLGMKMCCIYSGLALMREHLGWGLAPFLTILLCYPLIFVLNLTLSTWGQMRKSGAVLIGFGLIFVLGLVIVSFPDIRSIEDLKSSQDDLLSVAFQIGLCALLWRLGVSVTPHKTGSRHAHAWFQLGTLALLAFIALGSKAIIAVALFFIFAFTTLALARWDGSGFRTMGVLQAMKPRSLVLGILSILIPATILLLVLSPDLARTLVQALTALGNLLANWLNQAFIPAPAGKTIEIPFLSGCTMRGPKDEPLFPKTQAVPDGIGTGSEQALLWFVVAGLILAAAFLFITVSILRVKRRPEGTQGIPFEGASVRATLLKGLAALCGKLGRMLRGLFLLICNLRFVFSLRPKPVGEPLSEARDLYRALLQWAMKQGIPRPQWQTPLEYLKIIGKRFPEKDRELALITEVYIRARYGRLPPGREEFEAAMRAWWRVQGYE
jgi:hypothetical protein